MPRFSPKSEALLLTCHPDIVRVCRELIKQMDVSVLCGRRTREEQDKAFREGNSNCKYPQSAHNRVPSHAVDLAPYPIDWNNLERFKEMWLRFDAIARVLKDRGEIMSEFIWGGDFKRLKDCPHIEIKEK